MRITDISFDEWDRLGAEAGAEARAKAFAHGLPVTMSDDQHRIRVWPDGGTETTSRAKPTAAE